MSDRDGDNDVFVALADGSTPKQLTVSAVDEYTPQWAPVGGSIGFTSAVGGGGFDLFVTTALGDTTRLSEGTGIVRTWAWSASGMRITYDVQDALDPLASAVYLIRSDGLARSQLRMTSRSPQWSPDSTKILFIEDDGVSTTLATIAVDGTGYNNLVESPSTEPIRSARWAPNGSKIAFVQGAQGNNDIFIIDSSGANSLNVTSSVDDEQEVLWYPDGSRLMFVRASQSDRDIWSMRPDGSDATNLTNNPAHDDNPVFSPDGSEIAFQTNRDGNFEIYRMSSAGGPPTRITRDEAIEQAASWGSCR